MSLDLVQLGKLRGLIDVDGSWFALLASCCNQGFLVVGQTNLRERDACVKPVLGLLAVPDLSVVTNNKNFKWPVGDVDNRCEVNVLLIEILLVKSLKGLLLHDKIIEIDVSINTAGGKAGIVFEPVDAADFVYVAFALIVLRAVLRVEVVHPDGVVADSACEQMTAVAELDFPADLDLKGPRLR